MKRILMTCAAMAALTAPVLADDRFDAYGVAPMGGGVQHGIQYGVGYSVAKLGPIRLSPMADVSTIGGNTTLQPGVAATVGTKWADVGFAAIQRPGSMGAFQFKHVEVGAVVGIRIK